ncbi:hypothetical protein PspCFBP13528_16320 [Pseudomonas sp. CFBP13528]|nr:hypothetical protein PspCFBP13528_16320 [Pseudomonas sp. CFBP13528]
MNFSRASSLLHNAAAPTRNHDAKRVAVDLRRPVKPRWPQRGHTAIGGKPPPTFGPRSISWIHVGC